MVKIDSVLVRRFIRKTKRNFQTKKVNDSFCVEWTGSRNWNGYGRVHVDGRNKQAHRVAYAIYAFYNSILWDEQLQIDHLCRNRACVNPLHLEPVTATVNINRGAASRLLETPSDPFLDMYADYVSQKEKDQQ